MVNTEGVGGWAGPLESVWTLHSPATCTRSESASSLDAVDKAEVVE